MMGYGGGYGPGMMGYGGGYGPGMMGHGGSYGPGMMGYGPGAAAGVGPVERMDARLSFLKDQLKITAEQQAAWDAYAAQAKAQAAAMEKFFTQPPVAASTPAERIEQRAERAKLRAEQMKAMSAALKDLYAALAPEQKAVADRYFGGPRLSQGGPRGYGRWN
ncbi:MAG: Spy/CpxP family protein refolding chaperone [Burkholderiales bacterium]